MTSLATSVRSEREVAKLVGKLELEHDLYGATIDGWSAWRVLRNAVSIQAMRLPLSGPSTASGMSRLASAAWHVVSFFRVLCTARHHGIVIKSYTSALRECEDGRYRDAYFDGLLDTGIEAFKIEAVNSAAFAKRRHRAKRRAQLDSAGIAALGHLLALLSPPRELEPFFLRLSGLLKTDLGIELTPRKLSRMVGARRWQARLYALLLRRLHARTVIVADTGEYALNAACKALGIRFIELQHGIFTENHPDAIPAHARGTPRTLLLPDCLALFGSYWKDRLAYCAFPADSLVPVGCDAIDRHRRTCDAAAATKQKAMLRLIFTSQGLNTDSSCEWLRRIAAAAPEGLAWNLAIKLHPVYDAGPSAYDAVRGLPGIEILRGDAEPTIYQLLARADFHLSIASACHYDALGLCVPTIVLPLEGHELMLPLVDGQTAFLARDPADVWNIVTGAVNRDPDAYARYFTPGFVDNVRALIP